MVITNLQALKNDNRYAIKLLQQLTLSNEQQNLVFSPLGLMTLLAILLNVADDETTEQLLKTWYLTSDLQAIEAINLTLSQPYLTYNGQTNQQAQTPPAFKMANALLLNPHYQLTRTFQQLLSHYHTTPFMLDNQTIAKANDWVNTITHGQITELINYIDPNTLAVLINAISFHGKWPEHYFTKENTQYDIFYGNQASYVAIMQQHDLDHYYEDEKIQAIRVTYQDDRYQLLILLPKSDQANALDLLITELTATYLEQINRLINKPANNIVYQGSLYLPRFTIHYENDQLRELSQAIFGVELGYDMTKHQGAYFDKALTGLTSEQHLLLDQLIHKASISVTEQGTDAVTFTTAAVAVGARIEQPTVIPFIMQVDRPFLFAIQDSQGRLIFLGTVREIENAPRLHYF